LREVVLKMEGKPSEGGKANTGPALLGRVPRYGSWRELPLLLWALGLVLSINVAPAREERVSRTYDGSIPFPTGAFRAGETCVSLRAVMLSEDFFKGLTRLDSAAGPRFRRGSVPADSFPDSVSVEIESTLHRCQEAPAAVRVRAVPADFMKSLRFDLKWMHGLRTRPAEVLSLEATPVPWTETGEQRWLHKLVVRSRAVPLADRLVVSVLSAEGKYLTRMSGGP
jgi:hypothetical protein